MRRLAMAAALSMVSTIAAAQGLFPAEDIVTYLGFTAPAPLLPIGTPRPGTPIDFVACPERTAGGSWVATEPRTGYLYSLYPAPVAPNYIVRVTGVVAPEVMGSVPGWQLAPVRVIAGPQPCQSAGVIQHVPGSFGWLGIRPEPVVVPAAPVVAPRFVK